MKIDKEFALSHLRTIERYFERKKIDNFVEKIKDVIEFIETKQNPKNLST